MLSIKNLTKTKVDQKLLTALAKVVLKGENILKEKDISLVLLSQEEIQKINKQYRNIDSSTDVLSFEGEGEELGEIVICPKVVLKNTKTTFEKELAFVFIHAILHLLGYDHEKTEKEKELMQKKEQYYLDKIFS